MDTLPAMHKVLLFACINSLAFWVLTASNLSPLQMTNIAQCLFENRNQWFLKELNQPKSDAIIIAGFPGD